MERPDDRKLAERESRRDVDDDELGMLLQKCAYVAERLPLRTGDLSFAAEKRLP